MSSTRLGTPGVAGRDQGLAVHFNEVFTNSEPPAVDAIELINVGDEAIDISGWWITDDLDQPSAFIVPDGTAIGPGRLLVINESELGTFALSSAGEDLFLLSTDAQGRLDGGLEALSDAMQCNAMQCSAMQCCAVHFSSAQCNALQ